MNKKTSTEVLQAKSESLSTVLVIVSSGSLREEVNEIGSNLSVTS
jgi:hypothetical protein